MGKGTTALGIIGIIIGAGGFGFGFLAWIDQIRENVWYEFLDSVMTPTTTTPGEAIPDLSLIVDLSVPVSLHLLFTCVAVTNDVAGSYSDFFFYFLINDVKLDNPWARAGTYDESSADNRYSVTLQHYIVGMAPGRYNFSVLVLSEFAGNYIRECAFSIRSN